MEVLHFNSLYAIVLKHQSGLLYPHGTVCNIPNLTTTFKTHLKASGKQMLFPLHDTSAIALEFRIFWCKGTVKIHAELWRGCQRQLWLEGTETVPEAAVWVCTGVSPADGWWDGLLQLPCMGRMKCPGWASLWQPRQERCFLEHLPASARGQLLSLLVLWKSKADTRSPLLWPNSSTG